MSGGPGGGESADEVTAKILAAAATVFSMQGPDSVTVKWISLESGVPREEVHARWPDVLSILGAVLDDLAARIERLGIAPPTDESALTRVALIDRYQRIVARALLDGVNPASLQSDFPVVEMLVQRGIAERGVDERTARYRISQIYALEWGWRLFGPHLLAACGLGDEPPEVHANELFVLQEAITWLPPVAPPSATGGTGEAEADDQTER
jgi:AcrR family transcriptional regulator